MGVRGPDYLTTREVADLFNISPDAVTRWAHRWVESGEVKVIRTPGSQFRFWAADIRALLDAETSHPAGKARQDQD